METLAQKCDNNCKFHFPTQNGARIHAVERSFLYARNYKQIASGSTIESLRWQVRLIYQVGRPSAITGRGKFLAHALPNVDATSV